MSDHQKKEIDLINQAAKLGGLAYLVELETRLYAHRTTGLDKFTHAPSLELECEFFKNLAGNISEEQKIRIKACREFRNKLLHSNWWATCTPEEYKKEFAEVKYVVGLIRSLTGLSELKMRTDDPTEIDWSTFDFAESYICNTYRDVAAASTAYEIVMRHFANGIPEMKDIAYSEDKTLEDIQLALSKGLGFAPATHDLLENCRKARNKILHCDFYAAKTIATKIAPGKVKASGNVLVLKGERNWESELVSESSRKGAGAFGWALEGLSSGAATATFDALSTITKKIYFKDFVVDKSPQVK